MWGGEKRMPQGCPEGPSGRMREEPAPSCSPHRHTRLTLTRLQSSAPGCNSSSGHSLLSSEFGAAQPGICLGS